MTAAEKRYAEAKALLKKDTELTRKILAWKRQYFRLDTNGKAKKVVTGNNDLNDLSGKG